MWLGCGLQDTQEQGSCEQEVERLKEPPLVSEDEGGSRRAVKREVIEERTLTSQQMPVAQLALRQRMETMSAQFGEQRPQGPDIECVAAALEKWMKHIELREASRAGTRGIGKPVSFHRSR